MSHYFGGGIAGLIPIAALTPGVVDPAGARVLVFLRCDTLRRPARLKPTCLAAVALPTVASRADQDLGHATGARVGARADQRLNIQPRIPSAPTMSERHAAMGALGHDHGGGGASRA